MSASDNSIAWRVGALERDVEALQAGTIGRRELEEFRDSINSRVDKLIRVHEQEAEDRKETRARMVLALFMASAGLLTTVIGAVVATVLR